MAKVWEGWGQLEILARMIPMAFFSRAVMTGLFSIAVAVGKGDEAGTEAPDELLLGGAVELDRQDARVEVGELAEEGLLEAVFVEEAEVGVVGDGNDVAASLGDLLDGGDDGITFGNGRGVAAWVVGEVEQDHGLSFLFGGVSSIRP